jgi:succinylglutamate desuccinylase
MKWFKFDGLPTNFFNVLPHNIENWLPGPSVFKIRGENPDQPPLLVSTLLHGNETTGFFALQQFLKFYRDQEVGLPRTLIIVIGNPKASAKSSRHLQSQPDYNRIWATHRHPVDSKDDLSEENIMANEILDYVISEKPFAHVDIHNNTGKNPFYCVVSKIEDKFKKLAFSFGETLILITEPRGAFTVAMSDYCPAVVLECGMSGEGLGIIKVKEYLENLINLDTLNDLEYSNQIVYKTIARIIIKPNHIIDFNGDYDKDVNFSFISEIESFNFASVSKDTIICHSNESCTVPIVLDNNNNDVSSSYFYNENTDVKFKKEVIPSMLSTNIQVVLDDCLGYLLEIIERP